MSEPVTVPTCSTGAAEADQQRLTEFCPTFASLMDLLSRRWMGIILRVLMTGPHRFSEILAAVPGLSDPLLTQRLRELEASKVLVRRVLATSPVRVEYELTESGRDLEPALRALSDWAGRWMVPGPGGEPAAVLPASTGDRHQPRTGA
jgi:DNA-binding HxlR family transcriptional regulator